MVPLTVKSIAYVPPTTSAIASWGSYSHERFHA